MSGFEVTVVMAGVTEPDITAADDCWRDCDPELVVDLKAQEALSRHAVDSALTGTGAELVAVDTTLRCRGGGREELPGVYHCMAEVDCAVRSLHRAARPTAAVEVPPEAPYQPPQPPYTV